MRRPTFPRPLPQAVAMRPLLPPAPLSRCLIPSPVELVQERIAGLRQLLPDDRPAFNAKL